MPDGLYEHDALRWSEQQPDLLRRLSEGERVSEAIAMRQSIDLAKLYGDARHRAMPREIDGASVAALPEISPYSLDDLLADRPDTARLAGLG